MANKGSAHFRRTADSRTLCHEGSAPARITHISYEGSMGTECDTGAIYAGRHLVGDRPARRAELWSPKHPNLVARLRRKGRSYSEIIAVNHAVPADFTALCLLVLANGALAEEFAISSEAPFFVNLDVGAMFHFQDALQAGYFLPRATLMTWQREFVGASMIHELDFPPLAPAVLEMTAARLRGKFGIRNTDADLQPLFLMPGGRDAMQRRMSNWRDIEPGLENAGVRLMDPEAASLGELVRAVASAPRIIGISSPYLTAAMFRFPKRIVLTEITDTADGTPLHREMVSALQGQYEALPAEEFTAVDLD